MVDRNLLREFEVSDDELAAIVAGGDGTVDLDQFLSNGQSFEVGGIVSGKVIEIVGDQVVVDVGYKSEGLVPLNEWEDEPPPQPGESVEVLLEGMEDETGEIVLSRKKAHRMRAWEMVISKYHEGDVVKGKVTRKIKGGLLVDIGVNVFLPASQVDIRRPSDIADYIDSEIECMILKIDEGRRNIVVSRRKLIEITREQQKKQLLAEIEPGQVRMGTVKNIADFGAFVDLGGIDGLLHITDMSWGRINHPSDMVKIDDQIEVMVLHVDKDREKIALGLKQKSASPWENVADKYPVGTRVMGEVVNVMSYGAFVKLEEGIEGLVHISEMSWTKRINHPSELVQISDKIEVVVLGINKEKQEISLGMKQTQTNPWDQVAGKYPPGTMIEGTVRNLTNYGAFIEIEEGIDGLLHISDMSWTRKIGHPNELLEKGQRLSCQVLNVDQERKRIALGLKQLREDPWETDIPNRYEPNDVVKGKVTKLTNFGVFVELEPGLEGLLHISELADHKVDSPEEVVKVGDDIEVKILRVDRGERKIGLSRKKAHWTKGDEEGEEAEAAEAATGGAAKPESKDQKELKGGLGGGGPLFSMGGAVTEEGEAATGAEAASTAPEGASTPQGEASTDEKQPSEDEQSA
ncbi:30S ribosomal protein S1 [Singulisphaera acidiphila]|uniref:Small ribosomal subunit protein bS1 n=1 Tax=Singulisphaera acidiphila (strain ATCC BAA-1392 / DSM 18658 / VKM B-2454 / MOB10) TaxID=886293 RepID=L0DD27_SINAD|nr:30S ribosomal protein S1 [Singulisphaera acidiphila]AGA26556.1 ribosomal protein S1 [Singulisphaera acidiphila DSM 18658]